jgi:diacylglycerol kinase (ATP)
MRATLFHNPSAGHKADKDDILAAMKLADFDVRYVSVKQDDVEKALEKKTDLIVVAGGDGTITQILTKLPDRSTPVAVLPLGTANNIARSLGVAGTPQELVETWKPDNVRPVCTENLNANVVMVKSAQDRVRIDRSDPLNGAMDRRIFVQ